MVSVSRDQKKDLHTLNTPVCFWRKKGMKTSTGRVFPHVDIKYNRTHVHLPKLMLIKKSFSLTSASQTLSEDAFLLCVA